MLPSLLVRDIQQGLRQFLLTGFEASDEFMSGVMQRFVQGHCGLGGAIDGLSAPSRWPPRGSLATHVLPDVQ